MTKVVYFENLFPIGFVYLSIVNTNPSKWFGGTWKQIPTDYLLNIITSGSYGTSNSVMVGIEQHKLLLNKSL